MSAETLRRAAALMRERAEAATPGEPSWYAGRSGRGFEAVGDVYSSRAPSGTSSDICSYADTSDATHIASWHPAVAIAVADLLEQIAESDFQDLGFAETCTSVGSEALAVANAYLQETP